GKWLIAISVLVVTVVTGLGIVRGYELFEMFLWGVSLAVAAVPEALPAVVTGSLAIGMRKMAEKKAIVKRLPAVETLGSTTVICSDKTGTLTKGEMTVKKIYYNEKVFNISGTGYSPEGEVENIEILRKSNLAKIAILCNDSRLIKENHNFQIKGQPTEGALLVMAIKLGESPDKIRSAYPEIAAIPFSSKRKRMTTIHQQENGKKLAAVKGAPEIMLKLCNWILDDGKVKILDQKRRKQILNINNEMASQALRVIALAYRELPPELKRCTEECEKGLIFVGLTGMIDPPRKEVKDSIKECEKAGIRVIMITGDNKLTALAIAKELGIALKDEAIDGYEISKLTKDELSRYLDFVNVYARVSPEHKMKIVQILKDKGEIVAVTGDGVNDAPALKKSDIGVAMGITGTEVTKEAADMVLMDDNFTTIVSAIESGRGTFDNIKKYLSFLLSSNTGEILIMFIAGIIGLPLPLIALQILWVNLVTDGLPAIALGVDPPEPDIMERKPRSSRESVFDLGVKSIIFTVGILMAISALIVFHWYLRNPLHDLIKAQTMVFTIIVMFEMLNAFNCRSLRYSLTKIDPFKNRYLLIAVISSISLQLLVIYLPSLNIIFNTKALNFNDWLIVIIASIPAILGVEIMKAFFGKYQKN
ncbi:MAG: HAD-IC family P-type ATPase, partial [Candidatus Bathyarchaeota archaeon]|nr:HAD-IC family P-type ATPase [Candidatus Bathyarchaeota archaeon]